MPLFKNEKFDEDVLNRLKEVQFFSMYAHDDEIMNKVAGLFVRKRFSSGKVIINEGDYGDELFVLLSGEMDIVKETLQNEKYTVASLNADMGGIAVGELALIDNDQRSASVIANSECECLVIKRADFEKFGNEDPIIGLNITRAIASQLSSKLRKANSDVITLFSALVDEIAENE